MLAFPHYPLITSLLSSPSETPGLPLHSVTFFTTLHHNPHSTPNCLPHHSLHDRQLLLPAHHGRLYHAPHSTLPLIAPIIAPSPPPPQLSSPSLPPPSSLGQTTAVGRKKEKVRGGGEERRQGHERREGCEEDPAQDRSYQPCWSRPGPGGAVQGAGTAGAWGGVGAADLGLNLTYLFGAWAGGSPPSGSWLCYV